MADRQFTIKVIAHSLRNNTIAKYGSVVSERQLSANASDLVAAGFIEEVIPADSPIVVETKQEEAAKEVSEKPKGKPKAKKD